MTEQERASASAEHYKRMRAELDRRMSLDPQLRQISKKIKDGTADFNDTFRYSELVSKHIGAVMQAHIGEITNPLGKEYVCKALLEDHYEAINDVLGTVQVSLDEELGIHLKPIKPPKPLERIQQVAHALEDPGVKPEVIKRRAGAPVVNTAMSMHDSYIKINAQKRHDLGFKCYLTRVAVGGCCKWCTGIAGRYVYGDHPDDIFRRHDNCSCTVTFENGRQRQDVWSKRTWQADPAAVERQGFTPAVYSARDAESLQNIAMERLTLAGNRDIINTREMANGMRKSPFIPLSDEDKAHLLEEIAAIEADPKHFVFRDGFGTGYSDDRDIVFVSSNVFPPSDGSNHPRDLMSERAVLAHEYYGHRANRGTNLAKGSWNDEFRASYTAAKQCPNLTDEDRAYLILDAIERAHEAGVSIRYNDFMRRVLYG